MIRSSSNLGLFLLLQNLSPGYVNTGMTAAVTALVPKPENNKQALESRDIADACAYVLNTPPNVVVCIYVVVI